MKDIPKDNKTATSNFISDTENPVIDIFLHISTLYFMGIKLEIFFTKLSLGIGIIISPNKTIAPKTDVSNKEVAFVVLVIEDKKIPKEVNTNTMSIIIKDNSKSEA